MNTQANVADSQQALERLARKSSQEMEEVSVVASPGARLLGWAAKVVSLSSYNVYNVHLVEISDPGLTPDEIGGQLKAVNLAESFEQDGQLPAGTYVAMLKVGVKNVFYAPV